MTPFTYSPHCAIICAAILKVCDARQITEKALSVKDGTLSCVNDTQKIECNYNYQQKIHILGAGKAAAAMALGAESVLGEYLHAGIVAVKYGHCLPLSKVTCFEAGHPVPDKASELAGHLIYDYAQKCTENDIVLFLVSGGASACCVYPFYDEDNAIRFSLEDKKKLSQLLLESGACIEEINAVRKHFSLIKGGRLAEVLYPAQVITVIISDVIGNRLDTIASGMTVPDISTFKDVMNIFRKYDLYSRLPRLSAFVEYAVKTGKYETPKPDNNVFSRMLSIILSSNEHALNAAAMTAETLGYTVIRAENPLSGEASLAGKKVYQTLSEHRGSDKSLCFLWGGETTVTINGNGKGGRNQEAGLSFLNEAYIRNDSLKDVHVLFLATDGTDGPTDAAGALINENVIKRLYSADNNPLQYLKENNSYPFLEKYGALLRIGPTRTNICDIWVLLIQKDI